VDEGPCRKKGNRLVKEGGGRKDGAGRGRGQNTGIRNTVQGKNLYSKKGRTESTLLKKEKN